MTLKNYSIPNAESQRIWLWLQPLFLCIQWEIMMSKVIQQQHGLPLPAYLTLLGNLCAILRHVLPEKRNTHFKFHTWIMISVHNKAKLSLSLAKTRGIQLTQARDRATLLAVPILNTQEISLYHESDYTWMTLIFFFNWNPWDWIFELWRQETCKTPKNETGFFRMLLIKACFLEPQFVSQTIIHCVSFNLSLILEHYFNEWFYIWK